MREIKLIWIAKIQRATIKIFEAEDCDIEYVDRRVVKSNERAINTYLNKITEDKDLQQKIMKIIHENNFNSEDQTFRPICNELRKLGFTIKEGL